ncbi:MAG: TonB-dependent receptor plug domain-containing protein, partial [Segetibacter sp.]
MKHTFILLMLLFGLAAFTQAGAQGGGVTVTGIVKDNTGVVLQGVTVAEKGRSNTVSTDATGAFKIAVSGRNATLMVTSVGFEPQEVKASGNNVNITLIQTVKGLDELTVMGYSTKRREQISSAVAVVSGDKLRDVTSNNFVGLLQGKAPGVVVSSASGDPTAGSDVVIRGAGTINASTSPLYVVDGNIGGSFNPTDVETVTILKDAAATGLYGSRAANGVIIVTTKSGRAGKTRIEFNSTQGFSEASKGNFRMMNSQELYDYQKTFFNPNPAVLNTNTDWWDLAFRKGKVNSYTLSASGGTDKSQFYVAGNYYKEEGTVIDNDRTMYNLRTNLNQKLTDKLKLSVLLNGKYIKDNFTTSINNPPANPLVNDILGALTDAYLNLPYDSAFNADGSGKDPRFGTWLGRDRNNYFHLR